MPASSAAIAGVGTGNSGVMTVGVGGTFTAVVGMGGPIAAAGTIGGLAAKIALKSCPLVVSRENGTGGGADRAGGCDAGTETATGASDGSTAIDTGRGAPTCTETREAFLSPKHEHHNPYPIIVKIMRTRMIPIVMVQPFFRLEAKTNTTPTINTKNKMTINN